MAKRIYLTCGPAGSGKTTWIKNRITSNDIHISRDAIRFSMVQENENYFSKEKEVFQHFINAIKTSIYNPDINDIYIDATHLNEINRNKVLDKLPIELVDVICVNFHTSLKQTLVQNAFRSGRARVPEEVIHQMFQTFVPANENEKHKYFLIMNFQLDENFNLITW